MNNGAKIAPKKSMINAFKSGGDFHSRTAVDMFDYVKNAVDSGEVLLEWDYSKGESPKPLVKDKFASERRKAKTLNFSIVSVPFVCERGKGGLFV